MEAILNQVKYNGMAFDPTIYQVIQAMTLDINSILEFFVKGVTCFSTSQTGKKPP